MDNYNNNNWKKNLCLDYNVRLLCCFALIQPNESGWEQTLAPIILSIDEFPEN